MTSARQHPLVLAHVSDVHVSTRRLGWRPRDLVSKRLTGWVNLHLLGRAKRFRSSEIILRALGDDLRRTPPDHVVFSGDATALGFESEMVRAAELLGVSGPDPLPGLAVPGNHDYYVRRSARSGAFERNFAPWLTGERIGEEPYPFAQRVGHVWLIGVNSAVPNRLPWNARGLTGAAQIERLETLLSRLEGGPRILVTHYPVCRACGRQEKPSHALRDLDRLADVAQRGGVSLWLHGHRHDSYHHATTDRTSFPVICAGSATQEGLCSYTRYLIEGYHLRGLRRTFDPRHGEFREDKAFEMQLTGA